MGYLRRCLLSVVVLSSGWGQAAAHDFWIEPLDYRPCPGSSALVRLRIGHLDDTLPFPRDAAHERSFAAFDDLGERPVPGEQGADPAGRIAVRAPGFLVLGYHSRPQRGTLPAERFEAYLREEGFDWALGWRRERGLGAEPGEERFERYAKALLRAGAGGAGAGFRRRLGQALELVPLDDPYATGAEGSLRVALLAEGKPLPGARIAAYHVAIMNQPVLARTDADGVALLRLPHAGEWLLHGVALQPPPAAGEPWSSRWATLSFASGESGADRRCP